MGRWGTEGKKEGGQAATDEGGGGERLSLAVAGRVLYAT